MSVLRTYPARVKKVSRNGNGKSTGDTEAGDIKEGTIAKFMRKRTQLV
jgi:hypothetical protein